MISVTKESIIGDILDADQQTAQFFFEIGMHCLGCPASRGESIAQACAVHGTDADALVEKINAYLASKEGGKSRLPSAFRETFRACGESSSGRCDL